MQFARTMAAALLLLGSGLLAAGQTETVAQRVYSASKESVFLVYLNDSGGKPTALGSAFLVAPHILVTNAHVVDAGAPVLAVGPVRVPLKVVRVDEKNDLAILSVDIDFISSPLSLSSAAAVPGEQVYAIGNPEGLQNTISQGIVSGIRQIDDHDLLQVTCPISHGSSGGPILNSGGEAIGVAVGMLEDGQNLNFAVPVKYVRALLSAPESPETTASTCAASMSLLNAANDKRSKDEYSSDASSPYQQDTAALLKQVRIAVSACSQPSDLQTIACLGTSAWDLSDAGIEAARKLVRLAPSADTRALLAYVLYDRAEDEDFIAQISKDGSTEKTDALDSYSTFSGQAEQVANGISRGSGRDPFLIASFVIGGIKDHQKDLPGAIALHELDANANTTVCGTDLARSAFRQLITEANAAGEPDQAENWFERYKAKYQPAPYEWNAEGDRRFDATDYATAAGAYENAAAAGAGFAYDYCYAATGRYFQTQTDADAVLADGKECVNNSVTDTSDYDKKYYQEELPKVYRVMATVLDQRGVYGQALDYIKSSLAAGPDDAFALFEEAKILEDLQRYPECISASQAAIRDSDGKYVWMQFQLGNCYFDSEEWDKAAESYRISADGDPKDAASAYNLGLSLSRQGYTVDAQHWFREALRRSPDDELRSKILAALQP